MLTKLCCLFLITILYKAGVDAFETEIPKGKCFNFKIKTDSFFRVSVGVHNEDKSHNTSFYLYLGYKYAEKPTERYSGLYDTILKKYEVFDQLTNNLISSNEYTDFWLKFQNNLFEIGVKSSPEPFMVYKYVPDLDRIQITPGEAHVPLGDLVVPEHFECPNMIMEPTDRMLPNVITETIVNLGSSGSFITPTPKNKCLTFKIKAEPYFRVYVGKLNDNLDVDSIFYAYLGYKYSGKTGQYCGMYDPSLQKYTTYDKQTADLLSGDNYQEFFLKFDNNEFKIGLSSETEPLMTQKFDGNVEDYHIKIASHEQKSVLVFKQNTAVCPEQ